MKSPRFSVSRWKAFIAGHAQERIPGIKHVNYLTAGKAPGANGQISLWFKVVTAGGHKLKLLAREFLFKFRILRLQGGYQFLRVRQALFKAHIFLLLRFTTYCQLSSFCNRIQGQGDYRRNLRECGLEHLADAPVSVLLVETRKQLDEGTQLCRENLQRHKETLAKQASDAIPTKGAQS